jgi:hypothetical protein
MFYIVQLIVIHHVHIEHWIKNQNLGITLILFMYSLDELSNLFLTYQELNWAIIWGKVLPFSTHFFEISISVLLKMG